MAVLNLLLGLDGQQRVLRRAFLAMMTGFELLLEGYDQNVTLLQVTSPRPPVWISWGSGH